MKQANSKKSVKSTKLELSIQVANALIECKGDNQAVSLHSIDEGKVSHENNIRLTHEDLLKLACSFLKNPQINQLFPQVVLPEEFDPNVQPDKYDEQASLLKQERHQYKAIYGEPDHFGCISFLGRLKRDEEASMAWGNVLTIKGAKLRDSRSPAFEIQCTGPISVHMLVDVMIAIVSDPQTTGMHPQYAANYLRRWGENVFEGSSLNKDIPVVLTRDQKLQEEEDDEDFLDYEDDENLDHSYETEFANASISTTTKIDPNPELLQQVVELKSELEEIKQELKQRDLIISEQDRELAENQQALQKQAPQTSTATQKDITAANLDREKLKQKLRAADERAAKLSSFHESLTEREKALESQASSLTNQEDRMRQKQRELSEREEDVKKQEQLLAQLAQEHSSKESELTARENELGSGLKKQATAIETKAQELDQREAKLEADMIKFQKEAQTENRRIEKETQQALAKLEQVKTIQQQIGQTISKDFILREADMKTTQR